MYYRIILGRTLKVRVLSETTEQGYPEYDAEFTQINALAIYIRGLHYVYPGIKTARESLSIVNTLLKLENPQ